MQAVSGVVSFVVLESSCVWVTRVQGITLLMLTVCAVTKKRSLSWYRSANVPPAARTSGRNPVRIFVVHLLPSEEWADRKCHCNYMNTMGKTCSTPGETVNLKCEILFEYSEAWCTAWVT